MSRTLRHTAAVALTLALVGASLIYLAPHGSAAPKGRLVDDVPVTLTPDVLGADLPPEWDDETEADGDVETVDERVNAVAKVGDTVFLGGAFSKVKAGGQTYDRDNIVAFSASTGQLVGAFDPEVGAPVDTILPAPGGNAVFVGGRFDSVNGQPAHKFAKLTLNGDPAPGFDAPGINGRVRDLALSGGRLYIAGDFTHVGGRKHQRMATIDPQTGAVDPFFGLHFTGNHNGGFTSVREFDISSSGERLVAVGNFRLVGGAHREQLAMVDLGGSSAAVAGWRTSRYEGECGRHFDTYMRDVAFSPGGSYFGVVTTGGAARSEGALCDTAARWETGATDPDMQPTWVNYTGTDTLTAVAIADGVMYVGGHQRWLNNPHASGEAGPGGVPRPGLAALDPGNGVPLEWNPGRIPRGYGVTDMHVTSGGLWVGSDTEWIGQHRYRRERIAFFPFAGGTVVPQAKTARLPGDVYMFDERSETGGSGITYRSYDGTAVSDTGTADAGDLDERSVRGSFLLGETLWYGSADGKLYRRGFDGESFGEAVAPDPYAWPFRQNEQAKKFPGQPSEFYDRLPDVSGMFHAQDRVYYTLSGESALYYRDFAPSSAIVGAQRSVAAEGAAWSRVNGMFRSGGDLYYATENGDLHRMDFRDGAPVAGTGSVVGTEESWAAGGLFLQQGDGGPAGGGPADGGGDTGGPADDGGDGGGGTPGDIVPDLPPVDGGDNGQQPEGQDPGVVDPAPEGEGGDPAPAPEQPAAGGDAPPAGDGQQGGDAGTSPDRGDNEGPSRDGDRDRADAENEKRSGDDQIVAVSDRTGGGGGDTGGTAGGAPEQATAADTTKVSFAGGGAGADGDSESGGLPYTGFETGLLVAVALASLVIGVGCVLVTGGNTSPGGRRARPVS